MVKLLAIGIVALAVAAGAATVAWRAVPPSDGPAAVVDAPSAAAIFPKVLNH